MCYERNVENQMSFGKALELVKNGGLISRKDWVDENKFVFLRPSDNIGLETVVKLIKSLPQKVKDYYARDLDFDFVDGEGKVEFTPYLCLKDENGRIVNGWTPSQEDLLSDDWVEFIF